MLARHILSFQALQPLEVERMGLEPMTFAVSERRSNQLNYLSMCEAQPSLAENVPGVPQLFVRHGWWARDRRGYKPIGFQFPY